MYINMSTKELKKKSEDEERKRRKVAELRSEIVSLKEQLGKLEYEYSVKESEKQDAIDIYIENKKRLDFMMEIKENKLFSNVANHLFEQVTGPDYWSLISCYDNAMDAIQKEVSRIKQEIAYKHIKLNSI